MMRIAMASQASWCFFYSYVLARIHKLFLLTLVQSMLALVMKQLQSPSSRYLRCQAQLIIIETGEGKEEHIRIRLELCRLPEYSRKQVLSEVSSPC